MSWYSCNKNLFSALLKDIVTAVYSNRQNVRWTLSKVVLYRCSTCLETCIKQLRWTGGVIKRPFHNWHHPKAPGGHFSLPLRSSLVATHCLRLMAGSTAKSSQCDKVIWSHRGVESAVSVGSYIVIIQGWGNGLKIKTNGRWYHWTLIADSSVLSHTQMAMKQGGRWDLRLTAVLSTDVMLNKLKEIHSVFNKLVLKLRFIV